MKTFKQFVQIKDYAPNEGHVCHNNLGGARCDICFGPLTEEKSPKTLYHVTLTKHVPSIQKSGLRSFAAPSNWLKAGNKQRYGKGEIHAFEHEDDAHRWAANWDWKLHQKFGSGNVSVVKFNSADDWQEDTADPLAHAGAKGKWLKSSHPVHSKAILDVYPLTSDHTKRLAEKLKKGE